jgi:dienelactone hydrolase
MNTLGNLFPVVEAIAVANTPVLSFAHTELSLTEWRQAARQTALALLRYQPPATPLNAQVVEETDCGDYTREKVMFDSAPWMRIPAYVLVPKGLNGRRAPAIVGLHCHGGYYVQGKEKLLSTERESAHLAQYKAGGYEGQNIADELARRGFVVIVIDAIYFGERRIDFQTLPPELVKDVQRRAQFKTGVAGINEQYHLLEETTARHILAAGATWMGIMSHDDRSTVDYLLTRPEVDPDRIGCIGLSMGGMRTNWLYGSDPRIKAAVAAGWMTDWRLLLPRNVINHSWSQYVPGLTGALELSDLALLGNGAYLAMQCARDSLFPLDGMRATSARIEMMAAKAGLSDRIHCREYDVPHALTKAMFADALAWFERWL